MFHHYTHPNAVFINSVTLEVRQSSTLKFSSYHSVNTPSLHYEDQPVYAVREVIALFCEKVMKYVYAPSAVSSKYGDFKCQNIWCMYLSLRLLGLKGRFREANFEVLRASLK